MPKSVLAHANSIAPEPFLPPTNQEPRLYQITTELLCLICTQLLDRPLQLVCVTIICLRYCVTWVQFHHPPLTFPCCYNTLDSAHLRPPPTLLMEGLLVNCVRGCGKIVKVGQYQQHLAGSCLSHYNQVMDSPTKTTIKDVLSRPCTSPATPAEVKVAEHLVKKIIDQGSSSTSSDGSSIHYSYTWPSKLHKTKSF